MRERIAWHLEQMGRRGADRCNGTFSRHLLTELGDIELLVARTRRISTVEVVRAYARRVRRVERLILPCFVLRVSTPKVAEALLPVLRERVSASTVSRVARSLDEAVAGFYQRRLKRAYPVLVLDGVVMKRRTGAGSVKRVVLVALGMTPEGKRGVIEFCIVQGGRERRGRGF